MIPTVLVADRILEQILAESLLLEEGDLFSKKWLSIGVMVAGKRWPGMYYVDSDGERTNRNLYRVGSIFAYRVLDAGNTHFPFYKNMVYKNVKAQLWRNLKNIFIAETAFSSNFNAFLRTNALFWHG